ncbi:MAG: class I SAM-dependent methyltransferase [Candidatus Melainabacteria bacterium]|nr:class I SAM-dependent methyltransferase [Candidatus Melainabacteria bacterium]MBI3308132.1 class I SAM-dependent methyltransferase [Candidatus Melainabacteria bacterium]
MSDVETFITEHYKSLNDLQDDFRNKNLNNLIASKVRGDSILDIGCGTGHLMNTLLKQGKTVVGIEPITELVALAKKQNPHLNIIEYRAEDITKIDKKFSTITAVDVLEHIENDRETIKNLTNKLQEGGYLILAVPAYQFLYSIRDTSMGHYRRYSKNDLIKKITDCNLKIKELRYWNTLGVFHYLIIQKLLKQPGIVPLRTNKNKNLIEKILVNLLHFWFQFIENNINFGFGLTLICVAQKVK